MRHEVDRVNKVNDGLKTVNEEEKKRIARLEEELKEKGEELETAKTSLRELEVGCEEKKKMAEELAERLEAMEATGKPHDELEKQMAALVEKLQEVGFYNTKECLMGGSLLKYRL